MGDAALIKDNHVAAAARWSRRCGTVRAAATDLPARSKSTRSKHSTRSWPGAELVCSDKLPGLADPVAGSAANTGHRPPKTRVLGRLSLDTACGLRRDRRLPRHRGAHPSVCGMLESVGRLGADSRRSQPRPGGARRNPKRWPSLGLLTSSGTRRKIGCSNGSTSDPALWPNRGPDSQSRACRERRGRWLANRSIHPPRGDQRSTEVISGVRRDASTTQQHELCAARCVSSARAWCCGRNR